MTLWNRLRSVLRWIGRREKEESSLDAELQAYIDIAAAEKVRAGVEPNEARRLAHLELGGVEQTKECVREGRHGAFLDVLWQDIRLAGRLMHRDRSSTLIAVLTLAIGIAGITSIYSVVHGVLFRPLPWGTPETLITTVGAYTAMPASGGRIMPLPTGADWPDRNDVLETISARQATTVSVIHNSEAMAINGEWVAPNFFTVLQTKPALGRDFIAEDGRSPAESVIISYRLWQQRFSKTPYILGQTLKAPDGEMTIIGVMPRGFESPRAPAVDVWIPTTESLQNPFFTAVARLRPGITVEQAQQRLSATIREIEEQYPASAIKRRIQVHRPPQVPDDDRKMLGLLFASVGLILLIAIINVSNLLLARGVSRESEIAIRVALGASRMRLIRQSLTESLMLAIAGGMLGVASAYGLLGLIVMQLPQSFPRIADIYIDSTVLIFVCMTVVVATVLAGVWPAFTFSKPDVQSALTEGTRHTSESRKRRFLRHGFVALEVGLASLLLVGTVLIGSSFWNALKVPMGIDTERVIAAQLRIPRGRYANPVTRMAVRQNLLERVGRHPEVESAGMAASMPLAIAGMQYAFYVIDGVPYDPVTTTLKGIPIDSAVTSNYFHILQIPLVAGRTFRDDEPSVVINEALRQRHWPNSDPIGARMRFGPNPAGQWYTVVGVAKDHNNGFFSGLGNEHYPQVFRPCDSCDILLLKLRDVNASVANLIRKDVQEVDSLIPIIRVRSLEDLMLENGKWANPRFRSTLFIAFGASSLLLALVGVYGVTSYAASRRMQEIGIRIALGASRSAVIRLMLRQSLFPAVIGIASGLAGAAALTRFIQGFLIDISPTEPMVFLLVGSILGGLVAAANLIPIRRAAATNPLTALRCQ